MEIKHQELARCIQEHLSQELLLPQYLGQSNSLAGHCYVASEAFFHLAGGKQTSLKPMQIWHEGKSHWFLYDKKNSQVIDITAGQFRKPVPYAKAVGRGFLTKNPSKRAQKLMNAVTLALEER